MSYYRGDGSEYRSADPYYPSSYDRERGRDRNSYSREPAAYGRSHSSNRPLASSTAPRYHTGPRQICLQNERDRDTHIAPLAMRPQRYLDSRSYRPVDYTDSRRELSSISRYRSYSQSPSPPRIPTGPRTMRDELLRTRDRPFSDRMGSSRDPPRHDSRYSRDSRTDHGVVPNSFPGNKAYLDSLPPRIRPESAENHIFARNSFPSRRSGDFIDYRLSDTRLMNRYDTGRNAERNHNISYRSESESTAQNASQKLDSALPDPRVVSRARSDSFHPQIPRCFHDCRVPENFSHRPPTNSSSLSEHPENKKAFERSSADSTRALVEGDEVIKSGLKVWPLDKTSGYPRERSQSHSSRSSAIGIARTPSRPIPPTDDVEMKTSLKNHTTPIIPVLEEDMEEGQIAPSAMDVDHPQSSVDTLDSFLTPITIIRDNDLETSHRLPEYVPDSPVKTTAFPVVDDQEELFEEMQQLDQNIISKQEEIILCQSQQQRVKGEIASLAKQTEPESSSSSEYDKNELLDQIKSHCQAITKDNDLYTGRTYSSLNRYSFQRISPEVRKTIYTRLRQRGSKTLDKEKRLAVQYKELYESWQNYCMKLEKADSKKSSEPSPSVNSMTRNTRRGTAVGDVVLSEAEFSEILLRLEQENLRDPNVRAKLTSASIPPMILDPIEKSAFIQDYNNLIQYPVEHYGCKDEIVWTSEEKEMFAKSYALAPKQFGKIANEMHGKRATDCVLFYYRSKKFSDYRRLVAPKGKRHGIGKGKAKGRQSALMKDLRVDDEEEEEVEEEVEKVVEKEDAMAIEEERQDVSLTPVDRAPRKRVAKVGGRARGRGGKLRKEETPIDTREEEAATVLTFLQQGVSIADPLHLDKDTESGFQRSNTSFAQTSPAVKRSMTNSYWSVEEKFELEKLLAINGRNWTAIAEGLPQKTKVQVKNFYLKNEPGLLAIADEAERKLRALVPKLSETNTTVVDPSVPFSPESSLPKISMTPTVGYSLSLISPAESLTSHDRPTWRAESLPSLSLSSRYSTEKRPASQPLISYFAADEHTPERGWFPLGLTPTKSIFEQGEDGKISLPPLRPSHLPCAPDSPAFGQWTSSILPSPLPTQPSPRLYTSSNERHSIPELKAVESDEIFQRPLSTDKTES
ncbi:hypothetical protein NEOLI_002856 [Neolecta irregularis DAH-3]|uniref:Nuclear receptor corepressor 1 n=1 Tax=Neolecta irregularis (strain DAH-3) TaxID=1198029 RepID=A0A1U7LQF1_NEOID|nr:hypothetical protein NEOLI_002856 [Neolecta irregularis DAH-3]|eukprot:OLL24859.1 hypothetical protein NEOLI_002856 [Neolecta irregularis DAH-3]